MAISRDPASNGVRAQRLPSLKALRAFEVVGRHLNLYDAAEELSVTPSAISHQIRLLEEDLGVELFNRKGRGLELTGRGHQLLPLLSAIFSDLGSVVSEFRRNRDMATVSIQMPASFATRWFIPHLSSFEESHPGIDVKLLSNDETSPAPVDGLDCVIRFGRTGWTSYSEFPLCSEELVVVCSPRLLGNAGRIEPDQIARFRLLGVQHQPDAWKAWLHNLGLHLRGDVRTLVFQSRELAIRGAVENLGLALAGMVEVADDLRDGRLALALGSGNHHVNGTYYLAVRQARERDAGVAAFAGWIRREFSDQTNASTGHPWFVKDASIKPYVGS